MNMAVGVEALRRERPEWSPWLAVVEEALREAGGDRWDRTVPDAVEAQGSDPLLSGVSVVVDEGALRRFLERLVRIASRDGTPKMGTLPRAMRRDLDVAGLFAASVCQDADRLTEVATAAGADPEALQAVAALVSIPFLQACHRRWGSSISAAWAKG
jgi:hypothetical protein